MPTTPPAWTPTVDAVGALLRSRTKTPDGTEAGTFTAETRPTAAQVQELITVAVSDVVGAVEEHAVVVSDGTATIVDEYAYSAASGSAVVKTAMLVELSYFPEQVATGRSPYEQLAAMYEQRLSHLRRLLGADGDGSGTGGRVESPEYSFPARKVIGLDTLW